MEMIAEIRENNNYLRKSCKYVVLCISVTLVVIYSKYNMNIKYYVNVKLYLYKFFVFQSEIFINTQLHYFLQQFLYL